MRPCSANCSPGCSLGEQQIVQGQRLGYCTVWGWGEDDHDIVILATRSTMSTSRIRFSGIRATWLMHLSCWRVISYSMLTQSVLWIWRVQTCVTRSTDDKPRMHWRHRMRKDCDCECETCWSLKIHNSQTEVLATPLILICTNALWLIGIYTDNRENRQLRERDGPTAPWMLVTIRRMWLLQGM